MARFELFSERVQLKAKIIIVCITESHLDDKVSTQDILISGYLEPFRNDRNCFGGGVLIYISTFMLPVINTLEDDSIVFSTE
jgi:hypothetical protein